MKESNSFLTVHENKCIIIIIIIIQKRIECGVLPKWKMKNFTVSPCILIH